MSEEREEYKVPGLTIEEAAEILGQPVYTVRRHISAGRLPADKVPQHKKSSAPFRWEVKRSDVMKLKEQLQGQAVRIGRPPSENSLKRGEDYTYIYHKSSDEQASRITTVLTPEERATILEYFAKLKESDPEKFERMLKEMGQ